MRSGFASPYFANGSGVNRVANAGCYFGFFGVSYSAFAYINYGWPLLFPPPVGRPPPMCKNIILFYPPDCCAFAEVSPRTGFIWMLPLIVSVVVGMSTFISLLFWACYYRHLLLFFGHLRNFIMRGFMDYGGALTHFWRLRRSRNFKLG